MTAAKQTALNKFRKIPGVGKVIAEDLWNLGMRSAADLKKQDPEKLYLKLCRLQKMKVDRCMLYVFRAAMTNK